MRAVNRGVWETQCMSIRSFRKRSWRELEISNSWQGNSWKCQNWKRPESLVGRHSLSNCYKIMGETIENWG